MAKRTLSDMLNDAYDDDDVRAAVEDHIHELGTADAIVDGTRTLPTPQDAQAWMERRKAQEEREQRDRERHKPKQPPAPPKQPPPPIK